MEQPYESSGTCIAHQVEPDPQAPPWTNTISFGLSPYPTADLDGPSSLTGCTTSITLRGRKTACVDHFCTSAKVNRQHRQLCGSVRCSSSTQWVMRAAAHHHIKMWAMADLRGCRLRAYNSVVERHRCVVSKVGVTTIRKIEKKKHNLPWNRFTWDKARQNMPPPSTSRGQT